MGTAIRELREDDAAWRTSTLERGWGSTQVARFGQLVDAALLPGVVAELDGTPCGLATYALRPDGLEVVTLQSLHERVGIGRALMGRLKDHAHEVRADRLWLVTTTTTSGPSRSTSAGA